MSSVIDGMIAGMKKNKTPVLRLTDDDSPCVVREWISTGVDVLDIIVSDGKTIGGLPIGRMVEIYGDEAVGKSLLAIQATVQAQIAGCAVLYIDTESAVSVSVMETLGVNLDELMYDDPDTVEDVFSLIESAINAKGAVDKSAPLLIIWDSVAATTTKIEKESGFDKANVASQARAISAGLRKIIRMLSENNVCLVLINQTRDKIGITFGDPETTSGGNAIKYYASIRLRLKYHGKIKEDKKIVGVKTSVNVTKNKVGQPFRSGKLPIYFNFGVDNAEATFEFLKDAEVLEGGAGGNWSIIMPDGNVLKFKTAAFGDIYEANRDAFIEIMRQTL